MSGFLRIVIDFALTFVCVIAFTVAVAIIHWVFYALFRFKGVQSTYDWFFEDDGGWKDRALRRLLLISAGFAVVILIWAHFNGIEAPWR